MKVIIEWLTLNLARLFEAAATLVIGLAASRARRASPVALVTDRNLQYSRRKFACRWVIG